MLIYATIVRLPTPLNAAELQTASQQGQEGVRALLSQGTRREQISRIRDAAQALRQSAMESQTQHLIIQQARTLLSALQQQVESERTATTPAPQEVNERLRALETEVSEILSARQALLEAERQQSSFAGNRVIDVRETWEEGRMGQAAVISGGIIGAGVLVAMGSWLRRTFTGSTSRGFVHRLFHNGITKWVYRAAGVVLAVFGIQKLFGGLKEREYQEAQLARTAQNQVLGNAQNTTPTTNVTAPGAGEQQGSGQAAPQDTLIQPPRPVVTPLVGPPAPVTGTQARGGGGTTGEPLPVPRPAVLPTPAEVAPAPVLLETAIRPPAQPLALNTLEQIQGTTDLTQLVTRVRTLTGVGGRRNLASQPLDTELTRQLYADDGQLRPMSETHAQIDFEGQRMPRAQVLQILAERQIVQASNASQPALADFRTVLLMGGGRASSTRQRAYSQVEDGNLSQDTFEELEGITLDADRRITLMQFEETLVAELLDGAERFVTHRAQTARLLTALQDAVNRMDQGEERGRRQGVLDNLRARDRALSELEPRLRSVLRTVAQAASIRAATAQERLLRTMTEEDRLAQAFAALPIANDTQTLHQLSAASLTPEQVSAFFLLSPQQQTQVPIGTLRRQFRRLDAQVRNLTPPVTAAQLTQQVDRLQATIVVQARTVAAQPATTPADRELQTSAQAVISTYEQRGPQPAAFQVALLTFSDQAGSLLRRQFSDETGLPVARPDGGEAPQRTRLINGLLNRALSLNGDAVFEQMFISRNAANLPVLNRQFGEQVAWQIDEHHRELSLGGNLTQLLVTRQHLGAGTRPASPMAHLTPEERRQFRQATLSGNIVAQLSDEWLRYGVGFDEYLRTLDTVCAQHTQRQLGLTTMITEKFDQVLREIGRIAIEVHNYSWAIPDFAGARGIRALGVPLPESWDGYSLGDLARGLGDSVGVETADPQVLRTFLASWRSDVHDMRAIVERFNATSGPIRTGLTGTVSNLRALHAIVPPERLALTPGAPIAPTRAITPASIATVGQQYQAAVQRRDTARTAQPQVATTLATAQAEVTQLERQLAGLYEALLREINDPQTGAIKKLQDEVDKLTNDLTEKIKHHAGNFHALDLMQRRWLQSTATGLGVSWWTLGLPGLRNLPLARHLPLYSRTAGFVQRFTPPGAVRTLWRNLPTRTPTAAPPGNAALAQQTTRLQRLAQQPAGTPSAATNAAAQQLHTTLQAQAQQLRAVEAQIRTLERELRLASTTAGRRTEILRLLDAGETGLRAQQAGLQRSMASTMAGASDDVLRAAGRMRGGSLLAKFGIVAQGALLVLDLVDAQEASRACDQAEQSIRREMQQFAQRDSRLVCVNEAEGRYRYYKDDEQKDVLFEISLANFQTRAREQYARARVVSSAVALASGIGIMLRASNPWGWALLAIELVVRTSIDVSERNTYHRLVKNCPLPILLLLRGTPTLTAGTNEHALMRGCLANLFAEPDAELRKRLVFSYAMRRLQESNPDVFNRILQGTTLERGAADLERDFQDHALPMLCTQLFTIVTDSVPWEKMQQLDFSGGTVVFNEVTQTIFEDAIDRTAEHWAAHRTELRYFTLLEQRATAQQRLAGMQANNPERQALATELGQLDDEIFTLGLVQIFGRPLRDVPAETWRANRQRTRSSLLGNAYAQFLTDAPGRTWTEKCSRSPALRRVEATFRDPRMLYRRDGDRRIVRENLSGPPTYAPLDTDTHYDLTRPVHATHLLDEGYTVFTHRSLALPPTAFASINGLLPGRTSPWLLDNDQRHFRLSLQDVGRFVSNGRRSSVTPPYGHSFDPLVRPTILPIPTTTLDEVLHRDLLPLRTTAQASQRQLTAEVTGLLQRRTELQTEMQREADQAQRASRPPNFDAFEGRLAALQTDISAYTVRLQQYDGQLEPLRDGISLAERITNESLRAGLALPNQSFVGQEATRTRLAGLCRTCTWLPQASVYVTGTLEPTRDDPVIAAMLNRLADRTNLRAVHIRVSQGEGGRSVHLSFVESRDLAATQDTDVTVFHQGATTNEQGVTTYGLRTPATVVRLPFQDGRQWFEQDEITRSMPDPLTVFHAHQDAQHLRTQREFTAFTEGFGRLTTAQRLTRCLTRPNGLSELTRTPDGTIIYAVPQGTGEGRTLWLVRTTRLGVTSYQEVPATILATWRTQSQTQGASWQVPLPEAWQYPDADFRRRLAASANPALCNLPPVAEWTEDQRRDYALSTAQQQVVRVLTLPNDDVPHGTEASAVQRVLSLAGVNPQLADGARWRLDVYYRTAMRGSPLPDGPMRQQILQYQQLIGLPTTGVNQDQAAQQQFLGALLAQLSAQRDPNNAVQFSSAMEGLETLATAGAFGPQASQRTGLLRNAGLPQVPRWSPDSIERRGDTLTVPSDATPERRRIIEALQAIGRRSIGRFTTMQRWGQEVLCFQTSTRDPEEAQMLERYLQRCFTASGLRGVARAGTPPTTTWNDGRCTTVQLFVEWPTEAQLPLVQRAFTAPEGQQAVRHAETPERFAQESLWTLVSCLRPAAPQLANLRTRGQLEALGNTEADRIVAIVRLLEAAPTGGEGPQLRVVAGHLQFGTERLVERFGARLLESGAWDVILALLRHQRAAFRNSAVFDRLQERAQWLHTLGAPERTPAPPTPEVVTIADDRAHRIETWPADGANTSQEIRFSNRAEVEFPGAYIAEITPADGSPVMIGTRSAGSFPGDIPWRGGTATVRIWRCDRELEGAAQEAQNQDMDRASGERPSVPARAPELTLTLRQEAPTTNVAAWTQPEAEAPATVPLETQRLEGRPGSTVRVRVPGSSITQRTLRNEDGEARAPDGRIIYGQQVLELIIPEHGGFVDVWPLPERGTAVDGPPRLRIELLPQR
jgi:hypothetical protein